MLAALMTRRAVAGEALETDSSVSANCSSGREGGEMKGNHMNAIIEIFPESSLSDR